MTAAPKLTPPRRAGRAIRVTLAVLGCAGLAGCGSTHTSGTAADPAVVVPASAQFYAAAVVRPGEPLKSAARSAGRELSHENEPYLRLLGLLQTPGSPTLDYQHDVAPWLGMRAGVFVNGAAGLSQAGISRLLAPLARGGTGTSLGLPFGSAGLQGALVLDTTDSSKAQAFISTLAARAGAQSSSYHGVALHVRRDGVALGIVDRFVVIGSEAGLRSVIDTALGGPALVHASAYSQLAAAAPGDALARAYVALARSSPIPASSALGALLALLGGAQAIDVSIVPSASSLAIDVDSLAASGATAQAGLLASAAQGAQTLAELPGESWLAIGLPNLGTTLAADVGGIDAIGSLSSALTGASPSSKVSPGLSVRGLIEGILAPLRALSQNTPQARRVFGSWMGSGGLFASGDGIAELKGAAVIDSLNASASRAAVGELAAAMHSQGAAVQPVSISGTEASMEVTVSGLPVPLDIAAGRTASGAPRFVIGLGEPSVTEALRPTSTLSSSSSHSAAEAALGQGIHPALMLDVPTVLTLLEGVGLIEDPTVAPFVPYLRSLTSVAAGGKPLGSGIERFRIVAGLQSG